MTTRQHRAFGATLIALIVALTATVPTGSPDKAEAAGQDTVELNLDTVKIPTYQGGTEDEQMTEAEYRALVEGLSRPSTHDPPTFEASAHSRVTLSRAADILRQRGQDGMAWELDRVRMRLTEGVPCQ